MGIAITSLWPLCELMHASSGKRPAAVVCLVVIFQDEHGILVITQI